MTIAYNGVLGVWRPWTLDQLTAGTWTLTLQSPGKDPVTQTVTVEAGKVVSVPDFSLACTGDPVEPFAPWPFWLMGAGAIGAGLLRRRRTRLS